MRIASLWLGFAWLCAPAFAGDLCGTVDVLGRPLPAGFVTLASDPRPWPGPDALGGDRPHPGPTEKSLVRIRQGRFCIRDVAAGNYRIRVSPLDLWQPMALAYLGLPSGTEQYRLSVGAAGDPEVRGRDGASLLRRADLELAYAPPVPADDWASVDGALLLPEGTAEAPETGPALVMVQMQSPGVSSGYSYFFAWATGPFFAGARPFALAVRPGRVANIQVRLPGYGVSAMDPPFSLPDRLSLRFKTAQTVALRLRLAPAGKVLGTITDPDGRPFSPYLGSRDKEHRLFGLWLKNLVGDSQILGFADAEGRVELDQVPEGFFQAESTWRGEGFHASMGPASLRWVAAGATQRFDSTLFPESRAFVKADGRLAPLESAQFSFYNPKSRWVLGLDAGTPEPLGTSVLVFEEEARFAVFQSTEGIWMPTGVTARSKEEAARTKVPPGRYDLYLVESQDLLDSPSVRVLARRPGIAIRAGETVPLVFERDDFAATGKAELRGTLRASARWDAARLKSARSMSELHLMLAPRVNLYDGGGRLAGAAFAAIQGPELREFLEALGRDDAKTLASLFDRRPREFRISGLAPGRYRAEVVGFGYPPRDLPIDLKESEPRTLEVDLDSL